MIDTQAVKNKVLNLAMRGQLTEQSLEDGTAEELYSQIVTERARLVKEGKIKKEKPLGEINGDDLPFDIPKNWKWVYFGEIFSHNTGKALNASDKEGKLLEYITTSNMYWDHFELENLKEMYFKEDEIEKCTIRKGDLLICEGGDIGRSAIWNFPYEMRIQNHIHNLRPNLKTVSPVFYYYVMRLYKAINMINGQGIGLQGFSSKRVHPLIVPLPPASEQERIVERIEAIFEVLDKIDELQEQYTSNQDALKSKLIDAAIQGKLTEQLPEDGTSEELLQKIREEKSRLIQEGKGKKDKPLPDVTDAEKSFEIPENWRWVRFGTLMRNRDSERVPVSLSDRKKIKKIYDYYGASGVIDKVEEYLFDGKLLLIGEDGANLLSRSTPIAFMANGKYWVNNHAHVLDYYYFDYLDYVMHYINSISLVPYVTGSAQPKLNQDNMNKIPIPLPPLSEMGRIVELIDRIYEITNACQ